MERCSVAILWAIALAALLAARPARAGSYEDFFIAVVRNDADTITQLLQRGFDPDSRDPQGQPGLTLAVQKESERAVEALLASPALNVNVLNPPGESALMLAAIKGNQALAERLLARGAAINQPGWTPLHYAASGPNPKLVELLIGRGAEIDARSPNGSTPLMMAAGYGSEDAVRLLLAKGADAKKRNERDLRPVDFARRSGRQHLADQLDALSR
jgi:ankyrin repeat protein